jgi:hypothetical protein
LAQVASHAETLHHLAPPLSAIVLNLDRFSPYFNSPEKYGLNPVYPAKPYRYVYPFPEESLRRLAYFYDSDFFLGKADTHGFKTLQAVVNRWVEAHPRSYLLSVPRKHSLLVFDTRPCARKFVHRLTGVRRTIFECCDKATGLSAIVETVGPTVTAAEVESHLQSLVDDKLMLAVGGRYLSLATQMDPSLRRAKKRPLGGFRSTNVRAYSKKLAQAKDARAFLGLVAQSSVRKWNEARTAVRLKSLSLIVKTFSQTHTEVAVTARPGSQVAL